MLHTLITTYPLGMEDLGVLRNLLEGAADGVEVLVVYPHSGPQEELAVHPADVIGLQRGAQEQSLAKRGGQPTQRMCCGRDGNCATLYPSCWTRGRKRRWKRRSRSSTTGRGSTGDRNSWRLWKRTTRTTRGGGQNIEHKYHEHGYHRRHLRKLN